MAVGEEEERGHRGFNHELDFNSSNQLMQVPRPGLQSFVEAVEEA